MENMEENKTMYNPESIDVDASPVTSEVPEMPEVPEVPAAPDLAEVSAAPAAPAAPAKKKSGPSIGLILLLVLVLAGGALFWMMHNDKAKVRVIGVDTMQDSYDNVEAYVLSFIPAYTISPSDQQSGIPLASGEVESLLCMAGTDTGVTFWLQIDVDDYLNSIQAASGIDDTSTYYPATFDKPITLHGHMDYLEEVLFVPEDLRGELIFMVDKID